MVSNKLIIIGLTIALLLVGGLYLAEIKKFPVIFSVCDAGYEDCNPVARFKDRMSCETTNEEWGWLCDRTNPNDIRCRAEKSNISSGTCK